MPDKTKWDIDNENFNHFFHKLSALMTEKQREVLPKDLYFKLFKRGGDYDIKSTNKLSFLAKLFILIKALRKRVIIIVEDENGMDSEQYFNYMELVRKRKYDVSSAERLIEDTIFVTGNKELVDTFHGINGLSVSPAYNYIVASKQKIPPNKITEFIKKTEYICSHLVHYEANRKRIAMLTGLNFSEWMVLINLFHGNEVVSSSIYKITYKHSFNSSATKLKLAVSSLQKRGYIQKYGAMSNARVQITALGKDKTVEILKNYVLNH